MAAAARVIAASVIGPAHLATSRPCQDAVDWFAEGEYCHVAVADGLGSAEFSAEGAAVAVRAAIDTMQRKAVGSADLSSICFAAVANARDAVLGESEAKGCEPRDMACTLILASLHDGLLFTSHIGDGGAVALTPAGLVLASAPGDSEYVNETDHLCLDSYVDHIRTAATPGVQAFALFTDGIQRAVLTRHGGVFHPQEGFFEPVFNWAADSGKEEELVGLLQGKKLNEVSDDDKTLAVVTAGRGLSAGL